MKTLLVAAVAAIALASPAIAQLSNQFDQALQNYQTNQQLNDMMNRAIQGNQAAVNRGLSLINPPMPAVACTPFNRSMGYC
jgi:hypothetical protein